MKLPKDTPNLESDETFATGFNHTNAPQPERQLATSVDVEGNGNALLKQSLATSSVVSENVRSKGNSACRGEGNIAGDVLALNIENRF